MVHGWELDPGVLMAARMHLGLAELEKQGVVVSAYECVWPVWIHEEEGGWAWASWGGRAWW